ncbi:hypothetical protein ACF07V_04125 [Streptomyces sp. NPDC015661]|uniref:hypothetical protein n=1 Tax=Streptomyces sp. NPDC015661 TaxID=3364961 RepID=UPI0036FD1364
MVARDERLRASYGPAAQAAVLRGAGIEHLWRLELEPAPALVVSELRDGRCAERLVAEAGRETAIDAPFPLRADPGALVNPGR